MICAAVYPFACRLIVRKQIPGQRMKIDDVAGIFDHSRFRSRARLSRIPTKNQGSGEPIPAIRVETMAKHLLWNANEVPDNQLLAGNAYIAFSAAGWPGTRVKKFDTQRSRDRLLTDTARWGATQLSSEPILCYFAAMAGLADNHIKCAAQ